MIVCSCSRVSERAIDAAVLSGADDVDAIARACGAGARCGGCRPALDRLLAQRQADHQHLRRRIALSAA